MIEAGEISRALVEPEVPNMASMPSWVGDISVLGAKVEVALQALRAAIHEVRDWPVSERERCRIEGRRHEEARLKREEENPLPKLPANIDYTDMNEVDAWMRARVISRTGKSGN
jgi:hypothetical protein